jgi:hypothetical protein
MKRLRLLLIVCLMLGLCVSEVLGQYYYFGRNKVQYTEFNWQVLKTDHFDIYYYPEMQRLAEQGAGLAEEAYQYLEDRFNGNVARRIPLIFYSSHLYFEQTNTIPGFIPEGVGGFFEFMKGRVVIPSDGSVTQFRHVIWHELTHVFMHSKISRVLQDHRLPVDRYPPLWFVEGLAEYWSTTWDWQAEMVMRDAVLNDYVVGVSGMDLIGGSYVMYKEGQYVLQYIAENYGDEKILSLMEDFWKANSFSDVLKLTIGKDYDEFDKEFLYHLKKRFYPILEKSDQPSAVTESIYEEGFNSKPTFYVSSDTTREVFFIGNHTGYTCIYRKQIGKGNSDLDLVIQGEKTEEFEAFHLFQSKMDLSRFGMLAFVTKSGENDAIHTYDVKTKELLESYQFKGLVSIGSVSWSPDGRRLVFSSIDKSGYNDLYVFDTEDRSLQRLTDDFYDDRDPAWSPKGDKIAFSSDRTPYGSKGKYNLFLYDLPTGRIDYLTYGDENCFAPAWSHDGNKLAFTTDIDGVQNIWMMDFGKDGAVAESGNLSSHTLSADRTATDPCTQARKITNFTTAAYDPVWTDEDNLICSVFDNYRFQIRKVDGIKARYDSAGMVKPFDYVSIASDSLRNSAHWTTQTIQSTAGLNTTPYQRDYDLDIAQSQISTDPVFGTAGGAIVALSDLLGNDQYFFLIYNTAQSKDEFLKSFNVAISRVSLGQRTNYACGIFHFSGQRYDLTDPDLFFYERVFGGYFALSYSLSKFRRIEATISLANSDKEVFTDIQGRKALLLSNSISYVKDNTIWSPTGPIDGSRFNFTLAFTTDVQYSNVNYYTIIADYRQYFRLSKRTAYAARFQIFYNEGKEARRFFMGGSWDLRGYPRWSLRGKKLWLTSHEFRIPFIDAIGVKFPFGGIGFGAVRGAAFFDAGAVWDDKYTETLGSAGVGIRVNVLGVLVLRYDFGKRIENNFTRFSDEFFHQFFFGWDF